MKKNIACVIPNRNDAPTLNTSLMSIVTQMTPPTDAVVLDNCSTDNSLEVVGRYAEQYDFIKCVQYPVESNNWRRDAAINALAMTTCEYIHSLSANDYLDAHFYAAAQHTTNAGLIFAEYQVQNTDRQTQGFALAENVLPGNAEYPPHVLLGQLCNPRFFEGGPTTLLRRDVLEWLVRERFWEMEVWSDSIGYSVAAWLFGAAYIPFPCGYFTYDPNSGSEKAKRDMTKGLAMYRTACRFLDRQKFLPERLRTALQLKAYAQIPREWRFCELARLDEIQAAQSANGWSDSALDSKSEVTSFFPDTASDISDVTSVLPGRVDGIADTPPNVAATLARAADSTSSSSGTSA